MKITSFWFLITLLIIHTAKMCNSLCENVMKEIVCESLSAISETEISRIPGITDANRLTIRRSESEMFPKSFESAVSLQSLIITDNKINKIYHDAFKNLRVKYLHLGYNGINNIFPGAFNNLSFLGQLRLNNNNIEQIPVGLFANLPIKELTLSLNKISVIENMALEKLPNLKKLKLDHNKLESIFVHRILSYPQRLELLWLHNNSLTTVTNYMLQKLEELKVLNLGFNKILVIEPNSFEHTPKLNYLVLTNNHLKQIDGNIFPKTGLDNLETMYLDNNKLMFLSSNFFSRLSVLKKITIVGNPWFCSCLTFVQTLLAQSQIKDMCSEDYTSGQRPICVSDNPDKTECRHVYNNTLSEKYDNYKKSHPLYKPSMYCIL